MGDSKGLPAGEELFSLIQIWKIRLIQKHMKRKIFPFFILFIITVVFPSFSFAHPGNTDAYGCHTCRTNCPSWGLYYGEYHCHTPKYYLPPLIQPVPVYVPQYIYIPPSSPTFPYMTATWNLTPQEKGIFDLDVTLNDSNPTQYSAVISQYAGGDPGPLTDFTGNVFHFSNISPGKNYLNVKKAINGVWSTIQYWAIDVPQWYPPPTPTPFPTPTNSIINSLSIPDIPITSFLFFGIAGYLFYLLVKKVKK